MRHQYYAYSKQQLLENAKLPLEILPDNAAVFQAMAREMAEEIRKNNAAERRTVFICPVGPVGQYPYFVEQVNRERISLKNVWFFNMDEYLTDDGDYIAREDSLSFRGFMDRTVYTKIDQELLMPVEQRVFPNPHDWKQAGKLIDELGGVDICFGGIGINGHLAFNEAQPELTAEQFAALDTRVLRITQETRAANAIGDLNGALEDMPKLCVTIGMKEILGARKVRIGCFRDWHRAVVRRAACGEISAAFPASLLQTHPDALLRTTEFVAALPE